MDSREFVDGLVAEMQGLFAHLGEREALVAESGGRVEVVTLLELALRSELEASELAAFWLPTTPEIDGKLLLARQCGDEMRHYQLIVERLRTLGHDVAALQPMADGYSPLYQYLRGLRTSVERIAGGPFANEAIAQVRNAQFIAFCESRGDTATAALYRDVLQPDEVAHHRLGGDFLAAHATTPELQELAAAAVRTTLAIADELGTLAERTTGMHPIPAS